MKDKYLEIIDFRNFLNHFHGLRSFRPVSSHLSLQTVPRPWIFSTCFQTLDLKSTRANIPKNMNIRGIGYVGTDNTIQFVVK